MHVLQILIKFGHSLAISKLPLWASRRKPQGFFELLIEAVSLTSGDSGKLEEEVKTENVPSKTRCVFFNERRTGP